MKTVIVMRGPSGSGKGSWLKENAPDAYVVSADNYFLVPCGTAVSDKAVIHNGRPHEYVFDPSKIALAHSWCMSEFLKALKEDRPLIAIDNTNTHLWEFSNYLLAADLACYMTRVVSLRALTVDDINLCARRNQHGTPIEVVAKMSYEYEPYEGEEYQQIGRSLVELRASLEQDQ